jgi:secondary thiamine-phosphate synthase enzyme
MITQTQLQIATPGRSMIEITREIAQAVAKSDVVTGLCNIYIHHTSASLLICENHCPLVLRDLEAFMQRLLPDGDSLFQHVEEGPDDMPSHVRAALTQTFLTIPVTEKKLALGRWQGIFLWEHRLKAYTRNLTVSILE